MRQTILSIGLITFQNIIMLSWGYSVIMTWSLNNNFHNLSKSSICSRQSPYKVKLSHSFWKSCWTIIPLFKSFKFPYPLPKATFSSFKFLFFRLLLSLTIRFSSYLFHFRSCYTIADCYYSEALHWGISSLSSLSLRENNNKNSYARTTEVFIYLNNIRHQSISKVKIKREDFRALRDDKLAV